MLCTTYLRMVVMVSITDAISFAVDASSVLFIPSAVTRRLKAASCVMMRYHKSICNKITI